MAYREKLIEKYKCPKCGNEGVFSFSENDSPWVIPNERAIDYVEGEFEVKVVRDLLKPDKDVITCKKCGNVDEN